MSSKTYKLIKEYPGSIKLGTKVYKWNFLDTKSAWVYNECENRKVGIGINPEDYPEYFEEVVNDNITIDGFTINKVVRNIDNAEFKLGDTIRCSDKESNLYVEQTIKSFFISKESKICVRTSLTDDCGLHINNIEKIKLFTTEDGVDINIGDDYWVFDYGCLLNKTGEVHKVNKASCTHTGNDVNRKYFSTKEKALEYSENYNRFSIKDIKEAIYASFEWQNTENDELKYFKGKLGIK